MCTMQWHTYRIPMDNWIEKDMSPSSALWNRRFCWIRCTLLCPLEPRLHATKNAAKIFVVFFCWHFVGIRMNLSRMSRKKQRKWFFIRQICSFMGGSYDPVDMIFFTIHTDFFFPNNKYTPLKTNISPEKWWLEDVFPIEIVPFLRTC